MHRIAVNKLLYETPTVLIVLLQLLYRAIILCATVGDAADKMAVGARRRRLPPVEGVVHAFPAGEEDEAGGARPHLGRRQGGEAAGPRVRVRGFGRGGAWERQNKNCETSL